MAPTRTPRLLLLLAALALFGGTAAMMLRGGGEGAILGGRHRIERRGVPSSSAASPGGAPRPSAAPPVPEEPSPATAPAQVLVRVVRVPGREPVAGAEVFLQDSRCAWKGLSDDRGEVLFRGVESGPVLATARAEGRSGAPRWFQAGDDPDAALEIPLALDVVLEGVVRSKATGNPIAGALVATRYDPGWSPGGDRSRPPAPELSVANRSATTDADGRFRLEGLNGLQCCQIAATAPRYSRAVALFVPQKAEAVKAEGFVLLLDPSGRILGTVRDGEGRPLEGARVTAFPGATLVEFLQPGPPVPHEWTPLATSAADGSFAIDGIPRDLVYQVNATKEGFTLARGGGDLFLPDDPPEARCELVMDPAGSLVVDWSVEGDTAPQRADARADSVGPDAGSTAAFNCPRGHRMDGLPPGPVRVTVEAKGVGKGSVDAVVIAGAETRVVVPLGAGISLEGTVFGPGGAPVAGATVEIQPATAPVEGNPPPGASPALRWREGLHPQTRTRADGSFRLGGLPEGTSWLLRATAPGSNPTVTGPFVAPAAALRIEMAASGGLKGRVVLPPGAAEVPDLMIFYYPRDGMAAFTPGQSPIRSRGKFGDGTFQVEDLPVGPGVLVVSAARVQFGRDFLLEVAVEVPSGGFLDLGTLLLSASVGFDVRVRDEGGRPIQRASVSAKAGTRSVGGSEQIEPEGTYRFQDLPAGEAEIGAYAQGFLRTSRKVVVTKDTPPLEMVLDRGVLLKGMARDARGAPCTGFEVWYWPEGGKGPPYAMPRVDARGAFELRLAPGAYHIEIHHRLAPEPSASAEVRLEKGVDATLDLRVER